MAIESTVLYREVLNVCASGPRPVHYKWRAEVVANGKTIPAMGMVSFHRLRDYMKNYGDDDQLELVIPSGTFTYDIYPYRRNLKIRLYGTPQKEVVDGNDNRLPLKLMEFKAVTFDVSDESINQSSNNSRSKAAMDLSAANRYTFQLIDPVLEQLRLLQIGGIFHNQTPAELLRSLLTSYSLGLKLPEEQKPLGVGLVTPTNLNRRQVIPIPHGTPLVDQAGVQGLAKFLQFKEGGIYNGGIGCYYQTRHWYVFPPFDTSQYDKAAKKLTIANIPEREMRGIERTYKVEGNNVYVLATGATRYADSSEHSQLNSGNGVRYANASRVFDGLLSGEGNTAQAKRSSTLSEFIADPNPEQLVHAPMAKDKITSNPCAQMTPLLFKRGSLITLSWENANIDVVFPGMPARVVISRNEGLELLDGVLVAAEQFIGPTGNMGGDDPWLMTASLTLFVTRTKIDTVKNKA